VPSLAKSNDVLRGLSRFGCSKLWLSVRGLCRGGHKPWVATQTQNIVDIVTYMKKVLAMIAMS
jgi:hypothetical protein